MTEQSEEIGAIKDLNQGDFIRIKGKIYQINGITQSPFNLPNGIDIFNLEVRYLKDDLGEKLADLFGS